MTNSNTAIREFAEAEYPDIPGIPERATYNQIMATNRTNLIARVTALISEHYVAKEDAGYPREFVEWIGDDCSPCNLLRNDEEEFEKWVVYEINSMDWKFSCKTTDELFNYWKENER